MLQKYRDLYQMVRRTKPPLWPFALALVFTLLETGFSLWVPLLTRDLVDGISGDMLGSSTLWILIVVMLVEGIAGGGATYALGYTGQAVVASLRKRLFGHVVDLPVPFFDQNQSGELVSRMISDVEAIEALVATHLISFISGLVMIVGSITILCFLDWRMTVVLFSTVLLAILIIVPIALMMYRISKNLQDETASFSARVIQVLADIRLVKAAVAEDVERERGFASISRLFSLGLKETAVQAVMGPMITVSIMGALVIILAYGGGRVHDGGLQVGSLVAFILYLFNIVWPLLQFTYFGTALQKALGASERIRDLLKTEPESKQGSMKPGKGVALKFEDVSFGYSDETLLKNLNFAIEPGQVTALVGPSGSGKTTIMSLIARFYNPSSGGIKSGEMALGDIALRAWRQRLGYVSQDAPMIAGTIRENLIYGLDSEPDHQTILTAAKIAHAYDFVQAMPEGFETEVGERGVKLSGGQRQRLAIARAVLKDPDILLLDEATSNLDSQSEALIQEALDKLSKGKTTLVIAHRLSTVVHADLIVVLEKGQVTGSGTHEDLLENHQAYQQWVKQQFQGAVRKVSGVQEFCKLEG